MNIADKIRQDAPSLSRAFQKVAEFMLANPRDFIHLPMRDLAGAISVSEPTLIRFGRHYGFSGFPELRLAAAMAFASADASLSAQIEPSLADKADANLPTKRAIAQNAAAFLPKSGSILLDSGSTVFGIIDALKDHAGLTILTTGLQTFHALTGQTQHKLILPGGFYRPEAGALGGRLTESALASLSFDVGFISADAIQPDVGLSTFSEDEALLTRAMIRASRKTVVLADASKFQSSALHLVAPLEAVDAVISDTNLATDTATEITQQGPQLVLADPT